MRLKIQTGLLRWSSGPWHAEAKCSNNITRAWPLSCFPCASFTFRVQWMTVSLCVVGMTALVFQTDTARKAHDPRKTPHLSQQIWRKVEGWKFIGPIWFLYLSLGKEIILADRMEYASGLGLNQMPRGRGWRKYWVHRKFHVYYRKGNPWNGMKYLQIIYLIRG